MASDKEGWELFMLIRTLVENTVVSANFASEHGLSLHIETPDLNILFDVGASDLFAQNAQKLGVDIGAVDLLVISHGHYDHGGGLKKFLELNTKAPIYIREGAFGKHYAVHPKGTTRYIGLEEDIKGHGQLKLVAATDCFSPAPGVEIFANVGQVEPLPRANKGLFREEGGRRVRDVFAHEQNLIIYRGDKTLLLVGCAHNGVVNILRHFYNMKGFLPHYVLGGFHLSSPMGSQESLPQLEKIADYLLQTKAKYYTGHCTGLTAYEHLKALMGDRLGYLATGSVLKI